MGERERGRPVGRRRVKNWMRTASYLTFDAVIAAFTPDLKSMLVIIFAWAGVLFVEEMTG